MSLITCNHQKGLNFSLGYLSMVNGHWQGWAHTMSPTSDSIFY